MTIKKEKKNTTQRLEWLDVLKCIAMLLVLLGHCADTAGKESLKYYIYSFHMPIFFIISGIGYYLQTSRKNYSFREMLENKSRTLLWPYFALNFLSLIPWTINFRVLSESSLTYKELLLGIFYGHKNYVTGPSNSSWFVLTLFLAIMCFKILQIVMKENESMIICSMIGITTFGYALSMYKDEFFPPWHFDTVPIAMFFIACGYFFMKYYDYVLAFIGGLGRQFAILVVSIPIGYYCARFNVKISMSVNTYGDFLLFIGAVIGFSMACLILAMWCPKIKVLTFIGRNTMVYLMFHMPVYAFLIRCPGISEYFMIHPYIKAIVTFIILIPVSWIFEKYLYVFLGKRRTKK